MIELLNVHKAFGRHKVLDGVSFQVPEGSSLVIMGPSGTGKSVLLKHIIGLLRPDQGDVIVEGRSVPSLTDRELRSLRRDMGYLFQHGALINWLSVFDNVALPLRETTRLSETEVRERVDQVLEMVQLLDHGKKLPSEISGGMQKRVGLARALVTQPRLILYDEPEAGLDPGMSISISNVIRELQAKLNMTSVVVTHSMTCARLTGDRLAVFDQGRFIAEGVPDEVFQSDHPRVRDFLGDSPALQT
ncbi:MAG: ABC transporter ATP-binding protein [Planctomycetota bacterium]|nr:MAG: ABC transporter ATP-binding protein [Planctomycetota bacterium]